MSKYTEPIYIVDDEPSICDTLEGVFLDEGYSVIKCHNAETLFKKLQETPPALIMLDIWLPGIDGIDVLSELQKSHPQTSVIMMSGHAGIDSAVNAMKIGAYDFLEKPFNIDSLLKKVSSALNKKQYSISLPIEEDTLLKIDRSENLFLGTVSKKVSIEPQRTIKRDIVLNGNGLLSGKDTGLILSPLDDNQGIVFKTLAGQMIPAHVSYLESFLHYKKSKEFTANSSVLVANNAKIRTVEHLMASLSMFGITNVLIKVDGEIPNIDGSALDFCKLILDAGIVDQKSPVKKIVINEKISIGTEVQTDKYLFVEPFDGFEITMRIDYPAPIFEQTFTFNPNKQDFCQEIAPARSFNTFENIGMAQKFGIVGKGYLDSHIIIHNEEVINTELRFPDEFVRHKILDLIGDLYLLGHPMEGRVSANMTSHTFNHALSQKIYLAMLEGKEPLDAKQNNKNETEQKN